MTIKTGNAVVTVPDRTGARYTEATIHFLKAVEKQKKGM